MTALLDEIGARGAHHLIDATRTREFGGIGVSRTVTVLLTLAFNADARNEVFWSLGALAAELGLPKTDVRNALALIEASGVIERTGRTKGNGVVVWRFLDPDEWPVDRSRPTRTRLVDNSRDRAGDRAGNRAGNRAGYPAREGKGSESLPPDEAIPGVLVGVKSTPRTDGQTDESNDETTVPNGTLDAAVVLVDVPTSAHPRDRRGLADVLAIAASNRWTAEQLRHELVTARHNYAAMGGGAVLAFLRAAAHRPAPAAPIEETGDYCRDCGKRESACRRIPATISGHEFTAPDAPAAWTPPEAPTPEQRRHAAALQRIGTQYDPFKPRGGRRRTG